MVMEEADIQRITEAVAASVQAGLAGMVQAVVQQEMRALREDVAGLEQRIDVLDTGDGRPQIVAAQKPRRTLRPGNAPSGLCPESPEGGVRFVRGYVTYETTLPSVGA